MQNNIPTPRTDAWCELAMDADVSSVLELAKDYERELTQANEKIQELKKIVWLANEFKSTRADVPWNCKAMTDSADALCDAITQSKEPSK